MFIEKCAKVCLIAALTGQAAGRRGNGASTRAQRAEFIRFAASQNKHYKTYEEFGVRMGNFVKNHATVEQMNETLDDVTFADNFTSDMSDEEYAAMMGSPERLGGAFAAEVDKPSDHGRELQSSSSDQYINWVSAGKVHPVKDQGSCGSCWAFAALLVQESMEAIKNDTAPVRLSE